MMDSATVDTSVTKGLKDKKYKYFVVNNSLIYSYS
jgi:hypothetical protein